MVLSLHHREGERQDPICPRVGTGAARHTVLKTLLPVQMRAAVRRVELLHVQDEPDDGQTGDQHGELRAERGVGDHDHAGEYREGGCVGGTGLGCCEEAVVVL